jgi:hypothetical protein
MSTSVPLFEIPDDLTEDQLLYLTGSLMRGYFTDARNGGHEPHPNCETCAETVADYVEEARMFHRKT